MKKFIVAAKNHIMGAAEGDSGLKDAIGDLQDDFTFIIDSIERIGRVSSENEAIALAMKFQELATQMVTEVSEVNASLDN